MSSPKSEVPSIVFIFCGKRKSGKDHIVTLLHQEFMSEGDICDVLRLSEPLKSDYAKENGLEIARLMDSSSYKEQHRYDMIKWGERKRDADPGYFCRRCTESASGPVWIVSDARRPTDMEYFTSRYKCVSIRIHASEETRRGRGWTFQSGVDDADSECGLDDYTCDVAIENNGDELLLNKDIQQLKRIGLESSTNTIGIKE